MGEEFIGKIQQLNIKLASKQRPGQQFQLIAQCRGKLKDYQSSLQTSLKDLAQEIEHLQRKLQRKVKKQGQKKELQYFERDKKENFIELAQEWVEQFEDKLLKMKKQLRNEELDAERKMDESAEKHEQFVREQENKLEQSLKTLKREMGNWRDIHASEEAQLLALLREFQKQVTEERVKRAQKLQEIYGKLEARICGNQNKFQNTIRSHSERLKQKDKKNKQILEALLEII